MFCIFNYNYSYIQTYSQFQFTDINGTTPLFLYFVEDEETLNKKNFGKNYLLKSLLFTLFLALYNFKSTQSTYNTKIIYENELKRRWEINKVKMCVFVVCV